jgi:hypothetical protein
VVCFDVAVGEDDRSLEHIAQLANVARPVVRDERLERIGSQAWRPNAHRAPDIGEEPFSQQRDIAGAVAEGWQRNVEDSQSVQEILSKRPAFHCLNEIAVARSNDANVGFLEPRPAQPLILALLQKPQKLRLRREAHLAHFIEEQHASRGHLDVPGFRLLRAGEGATFVAEELRLEQLFRKRRAVDGDKGAMSTRRFPMNEPGNHFFAGARLALQEDRGLGGRDAHRCCHHTLPGGRRSNSTRVCVVAPNIS